jgi:hypothetical protein
MNLGLSNEGKNIDWKRYRCWLRHYATSRQVAGLNPRWGHWNSNWPNPSSRTMALGSTQPLTEISTRNLPGGKWRPALEADNLTAIREPIVCKMWEPQRLTTLWASTACYRDSFFSSFYIDWRYLRSECSGEYSDIRGRNWQKAGENCIMRNLVSFIPVQILLA